MKTVKLAIPTKGNKGIEDVVSDVFGRAETFTVVELINGSIRKVEVVRNQAVSYKHGAGPIATKMLLDIGINAVAAYELGIGVSTLLDQHNVEKFSVEADKPVKTAIETVINSISSR